MSERSAWIQWAALAATLSGCLELTPPEFLDSGVADMGDPADMAARPDRGVAPDMRVDLDQGPPPDMTPQRDGAVGVADAGAPDVFVADADVSPPPLPSTLYGGGEGTFESPYIVSSWDHLNNIRCYPDAFFAMPFSIQVGEEPAITPIGGGLSPRPGCPDDRPFTGNFDGYGFSICNLKVRAPGAQTPVGLFSQLSGEAVVHHLQIIGADVEGNEAPTGILAGRISSDAGSLVSLQRISVSGRVQGSGDVGGIAGQASRVRGGEIAVQATVSGPETVGGLFGRLTDGYLSVIRVDGAELSDISERLIAFVGGLAGVSGGTGEIINFMVDAEIPRGGRAFGGLFGRSEMSGVIGYGYTQGSYSGTLGGGGLLGESVGVLTLNRAFSVATIAGPPDYTGGVVGSHIGIEHVDLRYITQMPLLGCAGNRAPALDDCSSAGNIAYFYNSDNAPMYAWNNAAGDFWDFFADGLPTLYLLEPAPVTCE